MGTVKSVQREKFEADAFPHLEALWRTALWLTMRESSAENLVVKTMTQAYRTWDDSHDDAGNKALLFRILVRKFSKIGGRKYRPGTFLFENGKTPSDSGNGSRPHAQASVDESELERLTRIPGIGKKTYHEGGGKTSMESTNGNDMQEQSEKEFGQLI